MKHQQVSVDYWAMLKSMLIYGVLTGLGWLMFRLFNTVFSLPRRLRSQQQSIQDTLQDLQKRYPNLNITEEDLKNAEKDLEEWTKEMEQEKKDDQTDTEQKLESTPAVDEKEKDPTS